MLSSLLSVSKGVTAVIGSGGKTTLLSVLGAELSREGSVVLCTTTHFQPFSGLPYLENPSRAALQAALQRTPLLYVGATGADGKLSACTLSCKELSELADYVLVEADGSKRLPLKAHAAHEPVIPPCAGRVLCMVGASGFDRPIAQAVHRPEIFCALTGALPAQPATPALVAQVLVHEALADTYLVNQADTPALLKKARQLITGRRVFAGSLHRPGSFIAL